MVGYEFRMKNIMTDEQMLDNLKKLPAEFIDATHPKGVPHHQRYEMTITFYAGMAAMFTEMMKIFDRNSEDDEASGMEVQKLVDLAIKEAERLNHERFIVR